MIEKKGYFKGTVDEVGKQLGIEWGGVYKLHIYHAGFWSCLRGVSIIVVFQVGDRYVKVPYTSVETFLANWSLD